MTCTSSSGGTWIPLGRYEFNPADNAASPRPTTDNEPGEEETDDETAKADGLVEGQILSGIFPEKMCHPIPPSG